MRAGCNCVPVVCRMHAAWICARGGCGCVPMRFCAPRTRLCADVFVRAPEVRTSAARSGSRDDRSGTHMACAACVAQLSALLQHFRGPQLRPCDWRVIESSDDEFWARSDAVGCGLQAPSQGMAFPPVHEANFPCGTCHTSCVVAMDCLHTPCGAPVRLQKLLSPPLHLSSTESNHALGELPGMQHVPLHILDCAVAVLRHVHSCVYWSSFTAFAMCDEENRTIFDPGFRCIY